jgi:CHAD domain-containing protein
VINVLSLPDDSYCFFGAEALLKRLEALEQEIEGVTKAEDIECIHRMRVASRRIRSAFALFEECFADKDAEKWRKQIRQVTRSLSIARDLDVQIEFLKNFMDDLQDTRHILGIKRLLLRLQQQRKNSQPKIISVMDQLRSTGILGQITESSRIMRNLGQLRHKEHTLRVYERTYMAISLRLEEFLSHKDYIKQPDRTDELHAMRITAKRLRYTMEIFAPLYEDELKRPIEAIREVQTILGDFNDCVVWVNFLPQFLDEEKKRTFEYFGHTKTFSRIKAGILYLQDDRRRKQTEYYNSFIGYWEKIQEEDTWENLMKCIFDYVLKRGISL